MISRCKKTTLVALAAFVATACQAVAYTIDGPRRPKPWEMTAVYELEDCLKKLVSDTSIQIEGAEACFHVGDTEFARKQGVTSESLQDEQWTAKSFGSDVVLLGGGTRGTLYAVYHFLEDVCGVRWWSDDDEDVPSAGRLALKPFDLKGRPSFRCRQIYRKGRTNWRTAARCRLNGNGDYAIPIEWGAEWENASGNQTEVRPSSNAVIDVIKSMGFPIPSEYMIVDKIRACAERGEKGITVEQDNPDRSDMYELKFFLARKALEDPSLETNELLHEFYSRYYGPVAGKVRRAREHLRQIFDERGGSVPDTSPKGRFGWLTAEDLSLAARLFDEAEAAAKGNSKLERRVKRARISLDLLRAAIK